MELLKLALQNIEIDTKTPNIKFSKNLLSNKLNRKGEIMPVMNAGKKNSSIDGEKGPLFLYKNKKIRCVK